MNLLALLERGFNATNSINYEGNYQTDNLNTRLGGSALINTKQGKVDAELSGNLTVTAKTESDRTFVFKYKPGSLLFQADGGLYNVVKRDRTFTVNPYFTYDYSFNAQKYSYGFGHIMNFCSHFNLEVS